MDGLANPRFSKRYDSVSVEKAGGATYTPKNLSDFVAKQILRAAQKKKLDRPLRILDPAIGHGELLVSLLEQLKDEGHFDVEVHGFDTDFEAVDTATSRIRGMFPKANLQLRSGNFLEFVAGGLGTNSHGDLFQPNPPGAFDLIIANPPYVRTQIMGAKQAQTLATQFGLSGRVDLYYAFILGMSQVLKPHGVAGIIVSNRFMSTKSGAAVRQAIFDRFNLLQAWDLGDTRLFEAAVLPAVLLAEGKRQSQNTAPEFSSIYQTAEPAMVRASDPIAALDSEGVIEIEDGRRFEVQHGRLDTSGSSDGVWRIATPAVDEWLATVEARSWGTFRDIGKIRVGVKTCADKVFIRNDWKDSEISNSPELLRPLTTHHIARRFKALSSDKPSQILYPHEVVQGRRRAVDLALFPESKKYLTAHRPTLQGRKYVIEAGREWYEIWVPQDPEAWRQPKLVFRDISEQPTFWVDLDGSVVNGDCYWLISNKPSETDLIWLAAAVGNSTFIERFYDLRFNNKLYAGRRRFITQYVEKFPLPDPHSRIGKAIIKFAKEVFELTPSPKADHLQEELDKLVWEAFTG